MTSIKDNIYGVLFGQGYGDALGLCTEFMSKDQVRKYYGSKKISILNMVSDDHRDTWQPYDWTDDTDQMILVGRAITEYKERNNNNLEELSKIFAKHLSNWYYNGFQELGDSAGAGVGSYMGWVIKEPDFIKHPAKVANLIWELGDCCNSEDGSIMRTGIIGALNMGLNEKLEITETICRTTHADPRCVAGCIYVVVCISMFCDGNRNIEHVMDTAKNTSLQYIGDKKKYHYRQKFLKYIELQDINNIDLNKGTSRSSVKNPLRCLVYTLHRLSKYQEPYHTAIQYIVKQGGDADTNAAVVGSVLGAYYGYDNIKDSVQQLLHNSWLATQANMLLNLI